MLSPWIALLCFSGNCECVTQNDSFAHRLALCKRKAMAYSHPEENQTHSESILVQRLAAQSIDADLGENNLN